MNADSGLGKCLAVQQVTTGQYLTHLAWADPTGPIAEACLNRRGWQRAERWPVDAYDRDVAAVNPNHGIAYARAMGPPSTAPLKPRNEPSTMDCYGPVPFRKVTSHPRQPRRTIGERPGEHPPDQALTRLALRRIVGRQQTSVSAKPAHRWTCRAAFLTSPAAPLQALWMGPGSARSHP